MEKSKQSPAWFKVLLGMLFLLAIFRPGPQTVSESELAQVLVVAHAELELVKGAKGNTAYRFWAKNHQARFLITRAGGNAASGKGLDQIRENDTLFVKIKKSRLEDLSNRAKSITVYSLAKKNKSIFEVSGTNQEEKNRRRRWDILLSLMGGILVLRGLSLLSDKAMYIIIAVFAAMVITLKQLGMW